MPTCPQCGAAVEPTWDWCQRCGFDPEGLKPPHWRPAGAPTAGAGGAPAFGPPPAPATPPAFAPAPSALPPAGHPGLPDQPRSSLSSGASHRWVGIVVAVLVFAAVFGFRLSRSTSTSAPKIAIPPTSEVAPTTTAASAASGWAPWTAPDNSFTIEFPLPPTITEVPDPGPNVSYEFEVLASGPNDTWAYGIDIVELAPGSVASPDALLQAGTDTVIAGMHLTVSSRDASAFAGMPAVRLRGTDKDGVAIDAVIIVAGTRVYGFLGGSPTGSPTYDFEHFLGSFHIA